MQNGVIGLSKFVDGLLLTLFDISLIGFGGTLSGSRLFDGIDQSKVWPRRELIGIDLEE